MKESLPDNVLLLEVDRTVTASTASNESSSLQLLLVLRTLVGGAVLRRTSWRNAAQLERAARCSRPLDSGVRGSVRGSVRADHRHSRNQLAND